MTCKLNYFLSHQHGSHIQETSNKILVKKYVYMFLTRNVNRPPVGGYVISLATLRPYPKMNTFVHILPS